MGKQGLSDLAIRLVPDEVVPVTPAIRTPNSTKGDLSNPDGGSVVCDMVFFPQLGSNRFESPSLLDSEKPTEFLHRSNMIVRMLILMVIKA